jgi:hypothetical protein
VTDSELKEEGKKKQKMIDQIFDLNWDGEIDEIKRGEAHVPAQC